jgi:NAD(P)-dependent dehydrogenase (short-subunit alcohol dehydrogenase family)
MELRLDDKVALITGGSRGIGLEIARYYLDAGAKVMITSRKAEGCEAAAADIGNGREERVQWRTGNTGSEEDAEAVVNATIEEFGGVDILVNNAATNPYAGPLIDIDIPRWEKTMQVNVTAPLMWTQKCWTKHMKDNGGCIINLSSVGAFRTNQILGAYDISKSALIHQTEQLAAEMGPGVRVNAIAPGLIKTDFARALWEDGRGDVIAQNYPLKRLGETSDIAEAAVYLAAGASWVTGQVITLDGGGLQAFTDFA